MCVSKKTHLLARLHNALLHTFRTHSADVLDLVDARTGHTYQRAEGPRRDFANLVEHIVRRAHMVFLSHHEDFRALPPGMLSDCYTKLSPNQPEMGSTGVFSSMKSFSIRRNRNGRIERELCVDVQGLIVGWTVSFYLMGPLLFLFGALEEHLQHWFEGAHI